MNISSESDRHESSRLDRFRALVTEHMAKTGLRSTDQRRLILETFFASPDHVSLEELLTLVRARDPKVGYATVYRTMELLSKCGVANKRHFGDGCSRYELADSAHDHLICVECGSIVEFREDRIRALQRQQAARHGFVLQSQKNELYGICPRCQTHHRGLHATSLSGPAA